MTSKNRHGCLKIESVARHERATPHRVIARVRACEEYRPHPEERAFARVSKDGRESELCVHPSRRLLRKLLRMRSVFFTGSFAGTHTPCHLCWARYLP